jgi:hypothetical protein
VGRRFPRGGGARPRIKESKSGRVTLETPAKGISFGEEDERLGRRRSFGAGSPKTQGRLSFQLLKKANFLKNTILLGKIDMFLPIFEEKWYVTPSRFSGTYMYHALLGFLVGVET